jgi:type IV pilus biogenesis protein PilP
LDEATPLGPDPAPGVPAQTPASAQDRRDHSDPGTDLPETLSGAAAGDTETPAPPSSFADAPDGGPQTLDAGPDGVSPTQDSPETQPDNMPDAPPPFANPASSDLSVADDPDTQSWPGEDDEREGAPEQIRAVPRRGRKPAKTGKKLAGVARTAPAAPMPERKVMVGPRAEPDAPQVDQPRTEAEAMTVFGARNQTIGGKPRYLGLILTGALLLVLAVVAIWAAFFLDGPERPAQQGAAPDATAVAPATDGLALAPTEPDAAAPPEDLAAPPAETPPEDLAEAPAEDPPQEAATRQAATPQTADADPESAAPDNSLPAENIALPRPDGALANPLADLRLSAAQPQPAPPSHAAGLPPFDALFQFDAEGRLVATAEGVVTPDGYRLVAARPEILPPPRPGSDQPSNTTPDVAAQPEPMPPTTESPVEPADPLAEDPGQDTAAGSIAAASLAPQSPDADPAASTPDPLASPPEDPALVFAPDTTGPVTRPLQRPLGIAPPTEDPAQPEAEASTQPEQESSITSPRPPARPASVVAQARRAAETEQASVLAAAAAAASAASTAAIDSGSESALTIASSRRPAARPPNFARAVEAAVAAAVAPPVGTARPTAPSRSEDEDEPEAQVSRSAPNIPTSANVAKQATQARALNLGRLALIGVYGTANNRQALVREPGGRMVRVKVGDRLDGGRVTAITASELRYQKGSSVNALVMPKG